MMIPIWQGEEKKGSFAHPGEEKAVESGPID